MLEAVRVAVGRDIVRTERLVGGYTPQVVLRLHFSGGQTAVAKLAPPADVAVDGRLDWPREVEREIALFASHPMLDPWRPRFLADFSAGGWRGFVMEDLSSGLRPPPWTFEALDAVAVGLARLHRATHKDRGVIHGDVRSDNLFLVPGRGLVLCDWAEAGPGSGIDDGVYWAVGVQLESGIDARLAVARYVAAAAEEGEGVTAGAVAECVARLLALTRQRLQAMDLPVPVRRLREAELEVLLRLADG